MIEPNENQPARPFDAATVILTREKKNSGYEIFLMRRHQNMSFMGNAHVFPGGRLDPGDCDPGLVQWTRGRFLDQAPTLLREPGLSLEIARGLFFCAIRETFEEAGILLAGPETGPPVDLNDPAAKARFTDHREKLHDRKMDLKDLAARESLFFAVENLRPYAHWITPDIRKKRFDTRFFLARTPAGQTPVHDSIEMTDSLWVEPGRALELNLSGQLFLMPPTLVILEEMAGIPDLEDLYSLAAGRDIPVILPQAYVSGSMVGMKLPFDPEYHAPDFPREYNPDKPSRLILTKKGWRTVFFGSEEG